MDASTRELLFKIFRLYHEIKLKQQGLEQLTLPDSNNIDEIIVFQKKMFEVLKPLMLKPGRPKSQPSTIYSPFTNLEH